MEAMSMGVPNHVLANVYQPGQGIMAHQDGPLYFPCTCIISLGEPAVMRFFKKLPQGTRINSSIAAYFDKHSGLDLCHLQQLD